MKLAVEDSLVPLWFSRSLHTGVLVIRCGAKAPPPPNTLEFPFLKISLSRAAALWDQGLALAERPLNPVQKQTGNCCAAAVHQPGCRWATDMF